MISLVLNRKKLALYGLVLIFLMGGWWLLRQGTARPAPVEVKMDPRRVTTSQQIKPPPDAAGKEFFVDCRLTRDRLRSQRMELLQEIAANPDSSSEVRDQAQRDLMKLTESIGKETETEKLVVAQGFRDAVVMLQPKTVTVIIQARSLAPDQAQKVAETVGRSLGVDPGDVYVLPKP